MEPAGLSPDPHSPGRSVFRCACGRMQSYAPQDQRGGITETEAERIGWRMIDGAWVCPYCSGNTAALYKVFGMGEPPEEEG